ncbi:MAG: tetratricopeptide repeat protein [Spirochaetia bacterium]|nr:tetratricopeptide repeat protein [Spirochaetia bacterium]
MDDIKIMRKSGVLIMVLFLSFSLFSQDNVNDLFKLGEKYFFQKKYPIAEQTLLKVIEQNPSHPKAYSYLGDINLFNRQYNNALKYYNLAKNLSARPGYEYFRIGQIYLELKNSEEALNSFTTAYSVDPSFKPSLYQIGYIYLIYKRNKSKTIEYWKKFINEAPDDVQYEQVKKAITMLEDSSCEIPGENSGISMEEVLMNCGAIVKPEFAETHDKGAGSENQKVNNDTEELLNDAPNGF